MKRKYLPLVDVFQVVFKLLELVYKNIDFVSNSVKYSNRFR